MVLTAAEYEYKERINEQRIWKPKYLPRLREVNFVGKEVHVTWQPPVMQRAGTMITQDPGGLGKAEPWFSIKWFAYVKELDRQVSGEELYPIPKDTDARH